MKVNQFPTCCGAQIYSEFGNTVTATDRTKYSKEDVEYFLDRQEEYSRAVRTGLVMAILNEEQIKAIGPAFKKKKWRIVYDAYHPNHSSILFVVAKKLFKTPKEERDKAKANFNK